MPHDGAVIPATLRQSLLTVKPPLMARRTTLLLCAPVWLGLIGGTALGAPIQGVLVALGAYVVLFGAGQPLRPRLRAYAIAAVGLLASVALGMVVAPSLPGTWAAYLATAVLAVAVTRRIDPGPPGAYFFVLMVGGGTLLTGTSLPATLAAVAAGSLLAMAFGALDALITRPPARPAPTVPADVARRTLARVAVAVTATLALSALRDDAHPFWGVLVVVLVLSFPGTTGQLTGRAVARLVGTVAGVVLFVPVAGLHLGSAGYVAVLCVLLWFVARWTARNYAIGTTLITLLALFMSVPLTPDESPWQLAVDRGVDTLIAGIVVLVVLRALPGPRERPAEPTGQGPGREPGSDGS